MKPVTEQDLNQKVLSLKEAMAMIEANSPVAEGFWGTVGGGLAGGIPGAMVGGIPGALAGGAAGAYLGNKIGDKAGQIWDAVKQAWTTPVDSTQFGSSGKPSATAWPTTPEEIKAFQTAHNLTPDAKIGKLTMAALQQAGAVPPAGFVPVGTRGQAASPKTAGKGGATYADWKAADDIYQADTKKHDDEYLKQLADISKGRTERMAARDAQVAAQTPGGINPAIAAAFDKKMAMKEDTSLSSMLKTYMAIIEEATVPAPAQQTGTKFIPYNAKAPAAPAAPAPAQSIQHDAAAIANQQAPAQAQSASKPAVATPAAKVAPKSDPAVLKIQQDLIAKGYPIKADGVMGPKTQAAIDWQAQSDKRDSGLAAVSASPATAAVPGVAPGSAPVPGVAPGSAPVAAAPVAAAQDWKTPVQTSFAEGKSHVTFGHDQELARIISLSGK